MNGMNAKPRFQAKTVENGDKILSYIEKNIDTTIVASYAIQVVTAARRLGIISVRDNYDALPQDLRDYLKQTRRPGSEVTSSKSWEERIRSAEKEWWENVDPNILHPEDEGDLAERLRNSRDKETK